MKVDREGAWPQWQERLRLLEDLLRECREEFDNQTEPLPRPSGSLLVEKDLRSSPRPANITRAGQEESGKAMEDVSKDGVELTEKRTEAESTSTPTKKESSSFEVWPIVRSLFSSFIQLE